MNTQAQQPIPNTAAALMAVLSAAIMFAAGFTSQAATTYTWITDAGGEYGVSANWNPSTSVPGTTPSLNDVAQIGVASHLTPGTVLYDQSGYNYGFGNSSVQIGAIANSTASITMSAGTLSVTNTGGIGFALGNANPSTGSFTNNGGTLVVARPSTASLYYQDVASIPNAANATGQFVNVSGLSKFLGGIEIANGNPSTGIFTVTGGTVVDNGWFGVGRQNNGNGTFNLSGGIMCILRNPNNDGANSGGVSLSQGNPGTAVANISGGTLYCTKFHFNSSASANQTLNVSGGDIYVGYLGFYRGGPAASQTINISGGTFHTVDMVPVTAGSTIGDTNTIKADGTNWVWDANLPVNLMDNTFTVNGQTGPGYVTFAPDATRTITLSNAWNGVGGLVMNGPGTLALYGNSGYSGPTTISGGTVSGFGSVQGDVTVSATSTLAPGTLVPGTLTLGATSLTLNANTNLIRLGIDPNQIGNGVSDLLETTGNLILSGVSTIKLTALAPLPTPSDYAVIQYNGTPLLASDAAHFQAISPNPRYSVSIVDPSTTYPYVKVHVTGNAANLVWKGSAAAGGTNWDHTTLNWFNTNSSANDVFYDGDAVVFDDTANTNNVTVVGSENPASMTMSNNPLAFTFTGNGPLGGSLDVEGAGGLTTIATTNVPVFSTITPNRGVLLFNLANGGVNTLNSIISDNSLGNGTIIQGGANSLLLNADNSGFYGTLAVTNGVLQYATDAALGNDSSPLYVTNNGSLNVLSGATTKFITISGNGYNGQGALSGPANLANEGVHNLTLIGDASISAATRFDIFGGGTGGALTGNGFKLTELGPGAHIINAIGDTGLGDLHVVAGRLGFQGSVSMGDPTKTLTVESNTTVTFFSAVNPANGSGYEDKVLVLNTNATIDSAGAVNNFQGPVTLMGTNNIFGLRSSMHLWGPVGGAGNLVASTNDSVGNGGPGVTLYLEGANTYTGTTTVNPGAKVSLGASAVVGPTSLITLNVGSTLDATALSTPPLILGSGQTLAGLGTVSGDVTFGSGSTLSVGLSSTAVATLTASGNVIFQAGSTNRFKVNPGASPANDTVTGLSSVTYDGTLVVTKIGAGSFAADNSFQLFSAGSYNPSSFAAYVLPALAPNLAWDTSSLATDGTLRVITRPQITGADRMGDGNIELTFTSDALSSSYILWATTNVAKPLSQWDNLGGGTITGSPMTVPDLTSTNYAQRFYTISVP